MLACCSEVLYQLTWLCRNHTCAKSDSGAGVIQFLHNQQDQYKPIAQHANIMFLLLYTASSLKINHIFNLKHFILTDLCQ